MIRPVLLLAAAAVLVCTSCSGSGGNAAPSLASPAASSPVKPFDAPPDGAVVGETVAGKLKASVALHVKGGDSRKVKLDLQLNHDSAGGTIEQDGVPMQLLRVGDKVWLKFSAEMAKAAGLTGEALSAVVGKWVPTDSSKARLAELFREGLKRALNRDLFVDSIVDDLDQPGYSAGEPVDLAGTPAIRYRNGSRTIYLERYGSSYEMARYESPKEGTLDFDWNGDTKPFKAPAAEEIYSGPGS
ncbi:hypothetical protein [Amycolatopsis sp. WGS_07]|uniref:hypothetical protein n=1 Tax=Amycolatopsis sp. WGS_07 TaxID=3076764 RepID=UPI0038730578